MASPRFGRYFERVVVEGEVADERVVEWLGPAAVAADVRSAQRVRNLSPRVASSPMRLVPVRSLVSRLAPHPTTVGGDVLGGKPTILLSCSEKFKATVAAPVKSALADAGANAVIVSDEPLPLGVGWEPDAKVEWFMNAADALVALCTPDDQLDDGTVQCRQNIIDEIQRARQKPHLAQKIQVLKATEVRLPSNINPTYDQLDERSIASALPVIFDQLNEWGVLQRPAATPMTTAERLDRDIVGDLLFGLELGDHEEAERRVYALAPTLRKGQQVELVEQLVEVLFSAEGDEDNTTVLVAASVLEAMNRLDLALVRDQLLERMTLSPNFSIRSSAAMLLWDRASAGPALVPIDLLSRLAKPATEDWYVAAPAMAATKVLALSRDEAYRILESLAESEDVDDRSAAADAIRDIAGIDPVAVEPDFVQRLIRDRDDRVARRAREAAELIDGVTTEERSRRRMPFGL